MSVCCVAVRWDHTVDLHKIPKEEEHRWNGLEGWNYTSTFGQKFAGRRDVTQDVNTFDNLKLGEHRLLFCFFFCFFVATRELEKCGPFQSPRVLVADALWKLKDIFVCVWKVDVSAGRGRNSCCLVSHWAHNYLCSPGGAVSQSHAPNIGRLFLNIQQTVHQAHIWILWWVAEVNVYIWLKNLTVHGAAAIECIAIWVSYWKWCQIIECLDKNTNSFASLENNNEEREEKMYSCH